jgi:hypothetical protein
MLFFWKAALIAGLVKLLLATNRPGVCAGIYASLALGLTLMFGRSLTPALAGAAIVFALAWAYFKLLDYFEDDIWFWPILVVGFAIGLV